MKWPWQKETLPQVPKKRQRLLPEEIEELRIASLEMHYGDEPLYYSDPPEWPYPEECHGYSHDPR